MRNEVGDEPENVSSKKPRVSEIGKMPRDVLPQSGTVANTTSTGGGAVNRPSASIRKTCPATGVDPNLAGLLKNLIAALASGPRNARPAKGELRGPVRQSGRTVLPLVCTIAGARRMPTTPKFPQRYPFSEQINRK